MFHFLNENNDLKGRRFPLAKGIRKYLKQTRDAYNGDKTVDGWKRLNNILDMDGISYEEMKRIKNFFDNFDGTTENIEYILNGGDAMKTWVDNTLNTATTAIHDFKQAKKDAGISNAFRREHSKERATKSKNKPTIGKVQTNNVSQHLADNDSIKFESVQHNKTIIITEEQSRLLKEAMDIADEVRKVTDEIYGIMMQRREMLRPLPPHTTISASHYMI